MALVNQIEISQSDFEYALDRVHCAKGDFEEKSRFRNFLEWYIVRNGMPPIDDNSNIDRLEIEVSDLEDKLEESDNDNEKLRKAIKKIKLELLLHSKTNNRIPDVFSIINEIIWE